MKAAVVTDFHAPLQIQDVHTPEPFADEVLVRIETSGPVRIRTARARCPEAGRERARVTLRALLDSIGPDPAAEELVANDLEFHRRIVAFSGNSVLSSLLESMSGPATRARVWRGLTQAGARARTLAEHRAILDALTAHEPEVARSWATVHIAGVEQWLASMP